MFNFRGLITSTVSLKQTVFMPVPSLLGSLILVGKSSFRGVSLRLVSDMEAYTSSQTQLGNRTHDRAFLFYSLLL